MLTRRVLFTSLCTAVLGAGFMMPAFSSPPSNGTDGPGFRPQSLYGQYAYTQGKPTSYPQGFAAYPCTWSGSHDFAHGETAYRNGRYADAITQWKTAASKDCAIAAYKLGMLYYGGKSQITADRSLGAAWLQFAAESRTATDPYYQQMSQLAVGTLTKAQRAQYTADYARLQTSPGLPAAN